MNYCIKHGKKLNQLTLDEYHSFHPQIENDIYEDITLEASVGARQSYGGTAPDAVTKQIALAKSLL
ncbi:hypothetical protein [Limnobaculum zhutongyuii]|uniref:hypothetical protein n=1 Tax=Limnobaculum zhutongyuii TaxID=2498113 RepID=UPI001FE43018|nr:hypothetical protein [Limnobaculum zhutongyuii]